MTGRVMIVGAGPVGMTSALALARHDVPVTVLEAEDDLSLESRASTFHPPTLELLDELGVISPLLNIGLKAPIFQYRDAEEGVIAEFDLGVLADETPYPYRVQCEQHRLTRMLRETIASEQLDVEIRYRTPAVSVSSSDGRATLTVEVEGNPVEITAPILIGADGARSAVRTAAGIAFEGLTYPERYLVVTTTADLPGLVPGLSYINYVSGPGRWCVLLRTNRAWRVLFPVGETESDEEAISDDSVAARVAQAIGTDQAIDIEESSLYKVHQRLADSFSVGRLLLAGDAAHVNNPLGGLGMNSGLHDAYFFSYAIGKVWHGVGSETLLAATADIRRTICASYVNALGDRNWTSMRESDPVARRSRNKELRVVASDPNRARNYLRTSSMLESVRATREMLSYAS